LLKCQSLIEDCKVFLRGWDYPHFDHVVSGQDYIWSKTDWEIYKQYWRFYRSGQFVDYHGCVEDWWRGSTIDVELGKRYGPGEVLEVIMVLYQLTEIYEFASRLAQKQVFDGQMSLTIELRGMRGRKLVFLGKPFFGALGPYVSEEDASKFEATFVIQDLIARAPELALEQSLRVFELFNWRDARLPENVSSLRDDQRHLLERRL
ncbi:MAG: hypothetical protein ABSD49_15415, partial [Candidatus Bathyarchaeia archaeon]